MKRRCMKNNKNAKGITLIALVITIIVLLILAGVTISTLTGENGIISRASQASEETRKANSKEQVELAVAGSIVEDGKINLDSLNAQLKNIDNLTYKGNPISDTNKIERLPEKVVVDGYEIEIKGGINNNVPIPDGFYHVEGTTVEGGFVISDVKEDDLNNTKGGNQYVWIPVDGILNEDGTIEDVVDNGKILLGRYEFSSNGTPSELSGYAKYKEETKEEDMYDNTIANDIERFIDSVRNNRGYYIARFEASKGTNNKAESKYNKSVYSNVTQPQAAEACQNLYTGVGSDLMNSYAWDTAIIFIQKNGTNNKYSIQDGKSINSSKQKAGMSGDKQCNIYDMAANFREWTTETYAESSNDRHCIHRGGYYNFPTFYTSTRVCYNTTVATGDLSFRAILYW